ncbi:hypothetical protein MKW92_002579 [Papaver armeniacum]|nr:hypothetical protein MKW92_002579 [Papaver armeniacum]
MDNMTDSDDSWDFQQEEDEPFCSSYNSHSMTQGTRVCGGAEGSTSNQARSNAISLFMGMGFGEALVIKVVDECGEENRDAILEMLLTHKDCYALNAELASHLTNLDPSEMKNKQLLGMGFSEYDVLIAIESCDPRTPIHELMDFISANQIARSTSDNPFELPFEGHGPPDAKRKKLADENEACIKIPRKMIGFGALTYTSRWWPSWDVRTQLNCILTRMGSAPETDKIRRYIEDWGRHPSKDIQKQVIKLCRKWNFVWTGRNNVATLTAEEMEELLGYPSQHTRGGGISQTARYKALGNSFQVNTLAYHFSVLQNRFEGGINVLSLFAGIGGAEIALHQLGIKLNFVVSVEINEVNRKIFRKWSDNTEQQGILIDSINDVKLLTTERLEELVNLCNGFDLVVGGSPCNNLSGSNRFHRDGLEGPQSILFSIFARF